MPVATQPMKAGEAMTNNFNVEILDFSNLAEIEGAWMSGDFVALLDAMEYRETAGISDGELREMCIMSLQDLEPEEAAYLVLKHDMGDVLRDGQLRSMANEMLNEKLWEEYVNPALHERLFNVGSLLYAAFPRTFPVPDAVRIKLNVTAANAAARELLTASPDETFVVRMLADGMDDHAVLHRLYGEQLKGRWFPNAAEVAWIVRAQVVSHDVMTVEVTGSGYWLDALDQIDSYQSAAYADESGAP